MKLTGGKATSRSLQDGHENVTIGPEKTLAMVLHHGLGLSQSLVATLTKTTKNFIGKLVITGTRRTRNLADDEEDEAVEQLRLF